MPEEEKVSRKPPSFSFSDIAYLSRNGIKYGTIALVVLMVGRILLNLSIQLYNALFPDKPPPPTYGFGVLPALEFGTQYAEVKSYTLETKNGVLPVFPDRAKVFFMPLKKINLFSVDEAKKLAAQLDFVLQPDILSDTAYKWKRTSPFVATLEMDITSHNFYKKLDWSSDPTFLSSKALPTQSGAATEARTALRKYGLLQDDMATGEARVSFLRGVGSGYTTVPSLSEADFVQVDVFRTKIDDVYPIVRTNPSMGNARIIFSGKTGKTDRIVELEYNYFPVEYESFETYGLISPARAYQLLQEGSGFVASLDKGVSDVIIRNVYLGYYDSIDPQYYLQPVYIFTGDKNFVAYVPAAMMPSEVTE
jgi:hypothetical protein